MKKYIRSSIEPSDLTPERLQAIVEMVIQIMTSNIDDSTKCDKIKYVLKYFNLED